MFTTTQATPYTGNQSLLVNNIFSTSSPGPAIFCPQEQPDTNPPATDTLQFDHNLFNAATRPMFDPTCRQQIMASGNAMGDPLFVEGRMKGRRSKLCGSALPPSRKKRNESAAAADGGRIACFGHCVRTTVTSDCGPMVIPWVV
jgi:hypothetical protein